MAANSMNNPDRIKSPERIFYGWYVLIASFVILAISSGASFTVGVMLKPMISEFGWERGTFTLPFFVNMAVYALSLIIAGKAYDRYGPKWVIFCCSSLLSIGFVSIFFIQEFWQFLLFYGVVAASGLGGTTTSLFGAILSKWFDKYRGMAISIVLAGAGVGQFVIVPSIAQIVIAHGWRVSFLLMGLVIFIVNGLLTILVIRGDPEDLGYAPYGRSIEAISVKAQTTSFSTTGLGENIGLLKAMRTKTFWFFTLIMVVCGSGDFFVSMHHIALVTDHDISTIGASRMFAWFGLMSIAGVIAAGPAADKLGSKIPLIATFLLRAILFIFLFFVKTEISFYVFSLLFGFTLFITAPITTILVGKIFGYSNIGVISGFIITLHHLSGGASAYLGGVLFDKQGDYQIILIISMGMAIMAVFFGLFIKENSLVINQCIPANPQRR